MTTEITLFGIVDGDNSPFSLKIEPTQTVDDLRDAIKIKLTLRFNHIPYNELVLWSVSIPTGPDQQITLGDLNANEKTKLCYQASRISEVFGANPPQDTIHIIVEQTSAGRKRPIEVGLLTGSPALASKVADFSKEQGKDAPILNGRPFEKAGPPIALFHTVFGAFLRDKSSYIGREDQIDRGFSLEVSQLYNTEHQRLTAIKPTLGNILGDILDAPLFTVGEARSDGVLVTSVGSERAFRMILEGKNEIGTGGSDPTIQIAQYYRTFWSQDNIAVAVRHLE
ncbi:hypothetical protein BGX27_010595 [Mortierella sp. AM989]|nr:hypothetical protein BGX27_010595 [Mortierella sp. AM989]